MPYSSFSYIVIFSLSDEKKAHHTLKELTTNYNKANRRGLSTWNLDLTQRHTILSGKSRDPIIPPSIIPTTQNTQHMTF